MGLFNRNQNNNNCCCNNINANTIQKMEKYEKEPFIILGTGCDKCKSLESNLKKALKELSIDENIAHITEPTLISMYGVMKTPGLVIQSKVVSIGKVPSTDEIKELINKNYKKNMKSW